MSDKNIYFGPTRTGSITGEELLDNFKVYEIQIDDRVLGGKYFLPSEEGYDENNIPRINEQAYELGQRDVFLDTKYDSKTTDLQNQINNITMKSDVVDVVKTKADLNDYDVQTLFPSDVLKVLQDETEQYKCTYYRFDIQSGFSSIGPFEAVFNTHADMSTSGLSADDFVEVLADETHLDSDGNPQTTFYQYNGSSFVYAGCWKLIGSERTTLPLYITANTTTTPADNMMYVFTTNSGITATVNNGNDTPYYAGLEITFLATVDANVVYNGTSTLAMKAGQVFTLVYNGSAWIVNNSSSLNSYVNTPYKTYKTPGTFVYFYDGSSITSTYDIPADKCVLIVSWENANYATAIASTLATNTKTITVGSTTETITIPTNIIRIRNLIAGSWGNWSELVETDAFQILNEKRIVKKSNYIFNDAFTIDDNAPKKELSKNSSEVVYFKRDVSFLLNGTSSITFTLANIQGGDALDVNGMVRTFASGPTYSNTIHYWGKDGAYHDYVIPANQSVQFISNTYDWNGTKARLYWSPLPELEETLKNKTISKFDNLIMEDACELSSNTTLTANDVKKDVRYFITANSGITITLPNLTDANINKFSGITKTFTANDQNHTITFYNSDGTYQSTTLRAGETEKFKSYYNYTSGSEKLYWKKDVSDPDPVIWASSGNYSTGEVIYDNSNQIVASAGVVLTLGSGDKQGREVSITFLYDGTLVYTNQDNETLSEVISANTVSKFKWTGTGWIYETQKVGFSVVQELELIPKLSSNSDQGFDLVASSEITGKEAYHAFNEHPILYNVGNTVMFDDESFATDNDGNNAYLEVIHEAIVSRYKYLHIIDRGNPDNSDPQTVANDGITQYTISGTQDGGLTWTVLTTYNKSANDTDVNITLDTVNSYNGFKIATTGTSGTTRNVGFRKVQMYIPTKATVREIDETSNDISAYCPLVPLMTNNNEKGFALTQSSTKSGYEAFHAFNQHAITYYIGPNGMVSLESSSTDADGNSSWIACNHGAFKVSYGYLHLIDRGVSGIDPETVVDNGITEYTIYGYKNNAWQLITTYSKSASQTDVKIPLNTADEFYGFKVAATSVVGSTGDIGWRHIQMYVANKQEIQYVAQVDPNPTILSESIHSGLITFYNCKFVANTSGLTLTVDSADKLGRELMIIPNESLTIVFDDKSGTSQTLTLAQNQFATLIWNGTGWILKTFVNFTGTNKDGTSFNYNMDITV